MIYFPFGGALLSVTISSLYGFFFGCIFRLIGKTPTIINIVLSIPKESLFFGGSFFSRKSCIFGCNKSENKIVSGFLIFVSVLLFSLGFVLISYISCDGEVRFYILIIAIASFCISIVFKWILELVIKLSNNMIFIVLIILRIMLYPIHVILMNLIGKYYVMLRKLEKRIPRLSK